MNIEQERGRQLDIAKSKAIAAYTKQSVKVKTRQINRN